MDWDDLRHFAALAEEGSLSAAARRLGVDHATVARRIGALEAALHLTLADRRGRRWRLTAEGERIATLARRMGAEAEAVARAARGAQGALTGRVTVSAPPALAAHRLAAPLAALGARHPGLTLRLVGESRAASLGRGEADLALRLSRPEAGDLTCRKLGEMTFRLYAAPGWLAATAAGERQGVGYDAPMAGAPQQVAVGLPLAFEGSNLEIQQAAAAAGAGIAALPDFLAARDARLVPVPPGAVLLRREIWMILHRDLRRAAPVAAVAAALTGLFRPGWEAE